MLRITGIVLACLFFIMPAEARQRYIVHPDCNVLWPCEGVVAHPRGERVVKAMRGFGTAVKVYKPHREARQHRREYRIAKADYRHVVRKPKLRIVPAVVIVRNLTPESFGAIARPARYIAGRLICAVNVGSALAERGIKGTGSALAMSYLKWGRSAGGPVPGAVIVSARRGGGHVAIVSRVSNGVVYAWNATGGQNGWREIAYRKRVIDYRVPG